MCAIDNPETILSHHGFLLINKPTWLSSFGVVHQLRPITGEKKIGHAGTLDPFATGLLIVGIGKMYTTRLEEIQGLSKEYVATMVLGVGTDTMDCTGKVKQLNVVKNTVVTDKMINDAIAPFIGDFMQEPPIFSAKNVDGKRAYKLARKGRVTSLEKVPVFVSGITVLDIRNGLFPEITIRVNCSKGTYIRSLVRDIAKELNTCAFTKCLTRTKIGEYGVKNAVILEGLTLEKICQNIIKI